MWESDLERGELAIVVLPGGEVELQRYDALDSQPSSITLPIRTWHGIAALIESLAGSRSIRSPAHLLELNFGDTRLTIEPSGRVWVHHSGHQVCFCDATERWVFLHALELGRQIVADPSISACQIIVSSPTRQAGQLINVVGPGQPAPQVDLTTEQSRPATGGPVTDADLELVRRLLEPAQTLSDVLRVMGGSAAADGYTPEDRPAA